MVYVHRPLRHHTNPCVMYYDYRYRLTFFFIAGGLIIPPPKKNLLVCNEGDVIKMCRPFV